MGAYKKGFWLKLGPIGAMVDINSVIPSSKPTGLRRLCPEHHTPLNMAMKCVSEETEHIVEWNTWVNGKEVPGMKWAIVEDAPRFSADSEVQLVVVQAKEVDAATFMEGSVYYLESDSHTTDAWELLRRFASDPKLAVIGKATFRAGPTRKMWRLTTFRGFLVLRELKFPEAIRETPEMPTVKLAKELVAMAKQYVEANTVQFAKFDSGNEAIAQFEAIVATAPKVEFKGGVIPPGSDASKVIDLTEALEAALGKTKKKAS